MAKKAKKGKRRGEDTTDSDMATFTLATWNVQAAQAMLSAGRSIILDENGIYDLGDAPVGLDFTELHTSIICYGNIRFNYTGIGTAIRSSPGSSGIMENFEVDGIIDPQSGQPVGVGIDIAGGIDFDNFRVREFHTGMYFSNGEVVSYRKAFIRGCVLGIDFNIANAQNLIEFQRFTFRTNQTHVRIKKARTVSFTNVCDFESAYGYAIDCGSSTGGSFQGLVLERCWFEGNNSAYEASDNRASVYVDSGDTGLSVRGLTIRDCRWGNLNGQGGSQNKSTSHVYIGDGDFADTRIDGWQDMVISGPNGRRYNPVYDGQSLQGSIDAAIAQGAWLDLSGKTWNFSNPVVANGNLKIKNGRLEFIRPTPLSGTVTAITINGTPTIVDLELHRTAGADLIGMDVVNSAQGSMTRVKFSMWRSVSTGLRMSGGQIFYWDNVKFEECDRWLHIYGTQNVCTDFKFYRCSFSTAVGGTNFPGIHVENCRNLLFDGVSVQNNRQGHLLELSSCQRTRITGLSRFEDVGSITPGVSSHIRLSNSTQETTINATFNNTTPDVGGVFPAIISDDGTSSKTSTERCTFPGSSPTISLGLDNIDDGWSPNYSEEQAA